MWWFSPWHKEKGEKTLDLILFDIDNTLLDTSIYQLNSYENMFPRVFGVNGKLSQVAWNGAGKMTAEIIPEIAKMNGVDEITIRNKLSEAQEILSNIIVDSLPEKAGHHMLSGVPKILSNLGEIYTLGVLSGNPDIIAGRLLDWAHIRNLFTVESFGQEADNRWQLIENCIQKYQRMTQKKKISRDAVVLVGDSINDVQSANQAGIIAIGVTTGEHTQKQLEENGAHFVISSLNDLPGILDCLN